MPSGKSGGVAAMSGLSGVSMGSGMMSAMFGMQSGPPSASDAASHMIGNLDGDGDGALSLAEAGGEEASDAFGALDVDGDGSLTAAELASTLESLGPPPGAAGGGFSSADVALSLLEALDANSDDGVSSDEVSDAFGEDSEQAQSFSSLDANGDGSLSLSELTTAIESYKQTFWSDDAESQSDLADA